MRADALVQLTGRRVEKPWGRRDLPPEFRDGGVGRTPIGEIWFEDPQGRDLPLLIKYLFTSERLSIQVHPDDALALDLGHKRGKDEAWLILDAAPDATLGIGLRRRLSKDALRAAARDGSIEHLLDWRPVSAGEIYYSPAGTVHAIGAGLVLLEIQQNVDLTCRLYDYGRRRELHLDQGIRAAKPAASAQRQPARRVSASRRILVAGPKFAIERWTGPATIGWDISSDRPLWLVPLKGDARADGTLLRPGTAWCAAGPAQVTLAAGAELIAAYPPGDAPARWP